MSRTAPRARTLSVRRAVAPSQSTEIDADRPRTRADCVDGPRPCPWAGCKYHLYIDVNPTTGTLKLNFPHLEPTEIAETCALDVADRGEHTLEAVGGMVNLTRERTRQIEKRGLVALFADLMDAR